LHVASLCVLYRPSISHMSPASVHGTEWLHYAALNLKLLCPGQ
jgi:hypothetical protein